MGRQIKWSEFNDPTWLGALQQVFDEAWQQLEANPTVPASDPEQQRTNLAEMIILAYQRGLQPDQIKAALLGNQVRD
jgi:hypothetical protein